MLEETRAIRLGEARAQRAHARKSKLGQIMSDIKRADPLVISVRISPLMPRSGSDSTAPEIWVSHKRLFPTTADLLEFPIIKSLNETDATASEMQARFENHREEIDAHILEWRTKTERHLAELLRQGRVADRLKKAVAASKLAVERSEPNPFNGLSNDLKLLLRADSLFESEPG